MIRSLANSRVTNLPQAVVPAALHPCIPATGLLRQGYCDRATATGLMRQAATDRATTPNWRLTPWKATPAERKGFRVARAEGVTDGLSAAAGHTDPTDRAGYSALHARTYTRTYTRTHQPISSEILAVDVDVSPAAFVAPTR